MIKYITTADVDAALGTGWNGTANADECVLKANAWLQTRGVILNDDGTTPADVITAGAYLALLAATGALYADSTGNIKSRRVKADTVESETVYQDGASANSGQIELINALIAPYSRSAGGSVFVVARG